MKKKTISIILFIVAAALTVACAVSLYIDYTRYYEFGSAPFGVYVAERFIVYIIPAIACMVAGLIVRKKSEKANGDK